MKIFPCYEKLIKQFEEVGGYSREKMRQILEDESWKERFADLHVPEKMMLHYRMEGYLDALKCLSFINMKRMPVIIDSEEERLSQELTEELTEEIGRTVRDTISRFMAQRGLSDSGNCGNNPENLEFHNHQL